MNNEQLFRISIDSCISIQTEQLKQLSEHVKIVMKNGRIPGGFRTIIECYRGTTKTDADQIAELMRAAMYLWIDNEV